MMYQYKLHFFSPVHFGLEGIGQERLEQRIRSDSLWGAVIQKWLLLYQEDPDSLCSYPPFHISSTFPVIDETPFFPLPAGVMDHLISEAAKNEEPPVSVKDLKKIRFLAESLFRKVVAGYRLDFADVLGADVYPQPAADEHETGKANAAFTMVQRPRLEVDRLRGGGIEGKFFYCTDQFFHDGGGLFFLATFDDEEAHTKFNAALHLLGDCGLGADRTVGRGGFSFDSCRYEPPQPVEESAFLLLSLFHPRKDEVENGILDAPLTVYSLVKRYGHAASHQTSSFRRHDLWMLEEGSVLGMKPEGNISLVLEKSDELKIPHNVYRNGRAFYLPISAISGEVHS